MSPGDAASHNVSRLPPASDPEPSTREWFRYEPFHLKQRGAIRLIHVKPALCDGLIDCELWHTSPNSRYSTLSYVWGTVENAKTVLVNGRTLKVHKNLWLFLNTARQHFADRNLWIDAMCINQHDLQEKNHQVQLMSKIYSSSQEVLVWLGPDSSRAGYTLDAIRDFPAMSDEEKYKKHATDTPFWQGFREIHDTPYWQRAWIVQEYILPPTGILIQGKHWVSLELFQHAERWHHDVTMSHSGTMISDLLRYELFHASSYTSCQEVVGIRSEYAGQGKRQASSTLGLHRKCEDIRDRVYAMLEFTTHGHRIKVNYGLNPLELFFEKVWLELEPSDPELDDQHFYLWDNLPTTALALNLTPASVVMVRPFRPGPRQQVFYRVAELQ